MLSMPVAARAGGSAHAQHRRRYGKLTCGQRGDAPPSSVVRVAYVAVQKRAGGVAGEATAPTGSRSAPTANASSHDHGPTPPVSASFLARSCRVGNRACRPDGPGRTRRRAGPRARRARPPHVLADRAALVEARQRRLGDLRASLAAEDLELELRRPETLARAARPRTAGGSGSPLLG